MTMRGVKARKFRCFLAFTKANALEREKTIVEKKKKLQTYIEVLMVRQQKISPGQKDYTDSNQTNILNICERPPKEITRIMIQTSKFNQDVTYL